MSTVTEKTGAPATGPAAPAKAGTPTRKAAALTSDAGGKGAGQGPAAGGQQSPDSPPAKPAVEESGGTKPKRTLKPDQNRQDDDFGPSPGQRRGLGKIARKLRSLHGQIEGFGRKQLAIAIQAGRYLVSAKSAVGHGGFGKWVIHEARISIAGAERYMKLYYNRAALKGCNFTITGALDHLKDKPIVPPGTESGCGADRDKDADEALAEGVLLSAPDAAMVEERLLHTPGGKELLARIDTEQNKAEAAREKARRNREAARNAAFEMNAFGRWAYPRLGLKALSEKAEDVFGGIGGFSEFYFEANDHDAEKKIRQLVRELSDQKSLRYLCMFTVSPGQAKLAMKEKGWNFDDFHAGRGKWRMASEMTRDGLKAAERERRRQRLMAGVHKLTGAVGDTVTKALVTADNLPGKSEEQVIEDAAKLIREKRARDEAEAEKFRQEQAKTQPVAEQPGAAAPVVDPEAARIALVKLKHNKRDAERAVQSALLRKPKDTSELVALACQSLAPTVPARKPGK